MKSLWLAAAACAALLVTPACAQDASVKAGVDAWDKGDFKRAVDLWRASANKGNADAQFNLGQSYRMGRGVPQEPIWSASTGALRLERRLS